jgi:hypothetical protein
MHTNTLHWAWLIALGALLGCGESASERPSDEGLSPEEGPGHAQPGGEQVDRGASSPAQEQAPVASVLRYPLSVAESVQACGRPDGTSPWSSHAELGVALVGRWLLCSDAPFYGHGEVGIEFKDDGTWQLLFVENDLFVTRDEPALRGRWVFTHAATGSGGPLAIGVSVDSEPTGGMWIHQPRFALDPAQMVMDHLGERVRFSALPLSATSVEGQQLPQAQLVPTPGYADNVCAAFEGSHSWSNREELGEAVLGQWLLCSDAPFFYREGEAGIEFRADGTWHLLFAEGDTFVTSQGPGLWGHWAFTDTGTGSGGALAIGLTTANEASGTWIYVPEFSAGRAQMKLRDVRLSARLTSAQAAQAALKSSTASVNVRTRRGRRVSASAELRRPCRSASC